MTLQNIKKVIMFSKVIGAEVKKMSSASEVRVELVESCTFQSTKWSGQPTKPII